MTLPLISVVISTYNRSALLELALEEFINQKNIEKNEFEVIIVDNNSSDNTKDMVSNYQTEIIINYILEKKQGLGYVREAGLKNSKGRYVAFIDDDAYPLPNWLFLIKENIFKYEPDCICGPIFPYYITEKPKWFKDSYEIRSLGQKWQEVPPGTTYSGSNMIWKREILEELGGFNVKLGMKKDLLIGGEDTDLFYKYWTKFKGKVIFDPQIKVFHLTPDYKLNVPYMLKRSFAGGIAFSKINRNSNNLRKVTRSFRLVGGAIMLTLILPFRIFTHKYIENWFVEDISKIIFRLGWLYSNLGFKIDIKI